jgi:hypothetical protein
MAAKPARRPSHSDEGPSDRMRVACAKACDAFAAVSRRARTLNEELDEMTPLPTGVITAELHEEDSAVIVVREMIDGLAPKTGTG